MRARAAVLTALALGLACARKPVDRIVTIAVRSDVTGFFPNPPTKDESFTNLVNAHILEGLVRLDRDRHPVRAIANEWRTPDENRYVFDLAPDVTFSDGRSITSEDVVASLRANIDRDWPTSDYLRTIASVTADGPYRVTLTTKSPYPLLLYKLHYGFILPKGDVDKTPVPTVGTGPYRLASWRKGEGFELERNARYRGTAPAFQKARFVIVPEAAERIRRLLAGEVDIADEVPLERADELRKEPTLQVHAAPGARVLFLVLRVDRPPFSDPRVREAFDRAIDRGELVKNAYSGLTTTASQLVTPSIPGFNPALSLSPPDRPRAKALLREAGFPDGLDIRLDGTHNRYVNDRRMLVELARQLGEVGVRVTVNAMDKSEFFDFVDRGGSDLHLMGWSCGSGEAGEALESVVATRGPGRGSANSAGYSDGLLDSLLDEANRTLDPQIRMEKLKAALARVAETRPVLPLLIQSEAFAYSRRIDWTPGLNSSLRVADMRPAR